MRKLETDLEERMLCGSEFHTVGAQKLKERSPKDFVLARGTCRIWQSAEERSCLASVYMCTRSERYSGPTELTAP